MATGDGILDSSISHSGHPDAPGPVDHDADTQRYFTLIVECAKETAARRPADLTHVEFWEMRIHREWAYVNSVLMAPLPRPINRDPEGAAEYYTACLARLARECLMAAADLGYVFAEGMDDPEHIEASITGITSEMREVR